MFPLHRKVLWGCVSLGLTPICSLSCSQSQSVFLSKWLLLFTTWLKFSPSDTNVPISNPPLPANARGAFQFIQWALSLHLTQFITLSSLRHSASYWCYKVPLSSISLPPFLSLLSEFLILPHFLNDSFPKTHPMANYSSQSILLRGNTIHPVVLTSA